jgi:hypothetical protein
MRSISPAQSAARCSRTLSSPASASFSPSPSVPDQGVGRQARVAEHDVRHVGAAQAHLSLRGLHLHARRVRRHGEGGDAACAIATGAGQDHEQAGFGRVRHPTLPALDHPAAVYAPCRRAQGGGIAARFRL